MKGLNYFLNDVCILRDSYLQEKMEARKATTEHNMSGIRGLLSSMQICGGKISASYIIYCKDFFVSQTDEANTLDGCSLSFILDSHILLPETKQILINYFSEPLIKILVVHSGQQEDQSVEPKTLSSSNIQK